MYQTIDSIQEGDAPFKTIYFKYLGAIPANPPAWMTQTYELCTHDSRILMHNQLDTTDFVNTFTPSLTVNLTTTVIVLRLFTFYFSHSVYI